MRVQHLDHLNLSVASLEESARWYQRVFGFEKKEEGLYEGRPWQILQSGEACLCLYERPGFQLLDSCEAARRELHGISHYGLRIDDRAGWEATLEREGVEVFYGGEVRWPHSSAWYVKDPTGYEIEVALWDEGRASFG